MQRLFLLVLVLSACHSTRVTTDEMDGEEFCFWEQRFHRMSATDSLRSVSGYESPTLCYPNISEWIKLLDSFNITIYNRWGDTLWETTDVSSHWICNDSSICDIYPGTYYVVYRVYGKDSIENDTFWEPVRVWKNKLAR